ncbi:hypothetical protein BJ165DRAFT_1453848 [Panaeolus papilionaceus]|nr:hypothetical protein BJ165DRAFT_1453848 [Panaeolus papilionaceus]
MHKQFYYQRQHLIQSVDTLLYQLHALSFFLSPSLWIYITRFVTQHYCSLPIEFEGGWSLKFFYIVILMLNLPCLMSHSTKAVMEGRNVILDFIGMSYLPSRLQLCALDILIIILQLLLVTISYETSLYEATPTSQLVDPLLPDVSISSSSPTLPTYQIHSPTPLVPMKTKSRSDPNLAPLVLDLRIGLVRTRLTSPAPTGFSRQNTSRNALPLPNTAPWPLPSSLGILMQATMQMREARRARPQGPTTATTAVTGTNANRDIRIPGGMGTNLD